MKRDVSSKKAAGTTEMTGHLPHPMRRWTLEYVAALTLVCTAAIISQAAASEAEERDARATSLLAPFDGPDRPGGAAIVLADGEVVFEMAFGQANLEHDAPFTLDTPMQIGSLAKQFTAFGILLLEREGALTLDDELRTYVPDLPDYGNTLTIRHALHHTSGLRDQWGLFWMAGHLPSDLPRQSDMVKLITDQSRLNFDPGTEYLYVNSGYTLLAEVIERVSGQSYASFMGERVFAPLGMLHTRAITDATEPISGQADSYTRTDGGFAKVPYAAETMGPHNIVSTARDLSSWLRLFGQTGTPFANVLARMKQTGTLDDGTPLFYGMGLVDLGVGTARRIHHFGVDAGFRAYVGYHPALQGGVVLLANSSDFPMPDLSTALVLAVFGDDANASADSVEPSSLPKEIRDALIGQYAVESGPAIRRNAHPYESPLGVVGGPLVAIKQNGRGLVLESRSGGPMPIEGNPSDGLFIATRMGDIEIGLPQGSSPAERLSLEQYGRTVLRRMTAIETVPLKTYEGRY
jgi:CubicO group peptidase (beta-lactamase class C family)